MPRGIRRIQQAGKNGDPPHILLESLQLPDSGQKVVGIGPADDVDRAPVSLGKARGTRPAVRQNCLDPRVIVGGEQVAQIPPYSLAAECLGAHAALPSMRCHQLHGSAFYGVRPRKATGDPGFLRHP
jgi:hypothetical protein